MKKINKKELRASTENTLKEILAKHEISSPSKRTKKVIARVSKKFSGQLKQEIKKRFKKNVRAYKKIKNGEKTVAA